MHSKCASVRPS